MSDDPRLGTTLADRYRLNDLLGEGGMGKVYAAEHVLMRKKLAVKILHRELTTVPEVVKRFEREAMAAAHIEHPNVAAATDFGKLPDGSVFLVLEFVQGELLRDEIAKGPLRVERALHITRQIASALAGAHELEIVHRDLKPENVMLVDKGGDPDFVKVLDFGIAKVPIGEPGTSGGPIITRAGMVFGTPEYMAPEQALGQPVDGRADLYAVGVILYEMLAGVRPFSSQSQVGILGQQLSNPVPSFAKRAPGIVVPPAVEQLVVRLLDKEADQRFQNATSVVEAIDALVHPPVGSARLFTQRGGSPRAVMGSRPEQDSTPESGPIELPAFSTESDSGRMLRAGLESSPDQLPVNAGLDPIGPSAGGALPKKRPTSVTSPLSRLKVLGAQLARIVDVVESKRALLPPRLRSLPTPALLGGLALGALGVLIVLIAVFVKVASSDSAPVTGAPSARSEASSPVPSVAPVEDEATLELSRAEAEGAKALQALTAKRPNDARVWVALASAQLKEKRYKEAVEAVSRALEVDPKLNTSDKLASLLFLTAQSKSASNRTFELLEGPMGAKGADIIYDIALRKGVRKSVKARADRFLQSKEFARASSPALNIAVALRLSTTCRTTHGLLLRAKNVGDERCLTYLEPLKKKDGCGKTKSEDCFPCMRYDDVLGQAIFAIKKRTRKP